jgi:hypothetical protein
MQVAVHGGIASAVDTSTPTANVIAKTAMKSTARSFFIRFHLLSLMVISLELAPLDHGATLSGVTNGCTQPYDFTESE